MASILRPIVGAYIFEASSRRWDWGKVDCCTFVAGWVMACGNPDPMAFIRGRYDSERTALRRIREGGGLAPLWAQGMEDADIAFVGEADDLAPGDVGVIERPTECGLHQATAIWTGDRWATLGLRGVECGPADALAVWRP